MCESQCVTDLMRSELPKPGALSPDVELLGFGAMKRSCHTCLESPEEARVVPECAGDCAGEKVKR